MWLCQYLRFVSVLNSWLLSLKEQQNTFSSPKTLILAINPTEFTKNFLWINMNRVDLYKWIYFSVSFILVINFAFTNPFSVFALFILNKTRLHNPKWILIAWCLCCFRAGIYLMTKSWELVEDHKMRNA